MDIKNFNNNFQKLKYYFSRPLKYINIFFSSGKSLLSKPSKLKILQWKKLISIFNEYNCKTLLEFGSGRSTFFFLKNLDNLNEFLSINPNTEIKYTNICREKCHLLDSKKNCKIVNTETKIENIGSKTTINFIYQFSNRYDLVYIDGPSKKMNGSDLIHNILNSSIVSKIFFFDGRHDMVDEVIKMLKKNNILYSLNNSVLLNYTVIKINKFILESHE